MLKYLLALFILASIVCCLFFAIAVAVQDPVSIGYYPRLIENSLRDGKGGGNPPVSCDVAQLNSVPIPDGCSVSRTLGGRSFKCNWFERNISLKMHCGDIFIRKETPAQIVEKIIDILNDPCKYYKINKSAEEIYRRIENQLGCGDKYWDNSNIGLYSMNLPNKAIYWQPLRQVYEDEKFARKVLSEIRWQPNGSKK